MDVCANKWMLNGDIYYTGKDGWGVENPQTRVFCLRDAHTDVFVPSRLGSCPASPQFSTHLCPWAPGSPAPPQAPSRVASARFALPEPCSSLTLRGRPLGPRDFSAPPSVGCVGLGGQRAMSSSPPSHMFVESGRLTLNFSKLHLGTWPSALTRPNLPELCVGD